MPWTILPRWWTYRGWVLWMGLVPLLWRPGKQFLRLWLANRLDDMAYARFNVGMSYCNVALTIGSLVLFSLLVLSVKTAYLRSPKRGFWRAVRFGLREGLRKWPKTIGAQLKFVLPVSLGISWATVLLSNLAFRFSGPGFSHVCRLIGQLLGLLAQTWVMVFYGQLAADRYDYPEKKEEVETL